MLRSTCLVTAFVVVFISSFAQNIPPILKETSYRRGIYRNFTEFLNNAPSITEGFSVEASGERFRLVFQDSVVSRRDTKAFWGFSTGDSIFVNTGNYQDAKVYRLMKAVDRYCYWVDHITHVHSASSALPAPMVVPVPHTTTEGVLLNINNGNFYILNKQMMFSILKNDAQLLNQYKNSPDSRGKIDVMFSFLSKYNAVHRNEIGRIEKDASIVLFRRLKKERADTVAVATTDSISYVVGPGQSARFHFTQLTATLCAGTSCKDFALSNSATNYIQCTYQENDPQPKLELVEPRVGEFYLREIEGAKERGKR